MTLSDLGAIGEFVGAIGVVITLIYLAYQIRQKTQQLQQASSMAKATAVNNSNIALRQTRQSIFQSEALPAFFLEVKLAPNCPSWSCYAIVLCCRKLPM